MIGSRLLHLARAWFDETTVSRVFEPLIADWQLECLQASGANRILCRVRGYACFAMSFAIALPRQVQQRLPEKVTFTGWLGAEAFVALGVIAQIYYMQNEWAAYDVHMSQPSLLFPATLGTALPLALVPMAIILMNLRGVRPHEARAMTLRVALIAMVVMMPLLIWITPTANQSWREAQMTGAPRGMRELTVPELLAAQPPAENGYWQPRHWHAQRAEELSVRASVMIMPLTLAFFGVAVGAMSRRYTYLRALVLWVAVGIFWLRDVNAGWTVHSVFLALAAGAHWYKPGDPRLPSVQQPA